MILTLCPCLDGDSKMHAKVERRDYAPNSFKMFLNNLTLAMII